MEGQKIFVIISSIINIALLGFALYLLMNETGIGLFLTLFPLGVGLITFFITKKIKNFELIRALKYFNIAYFASYLIPVGVFISFIFMKGPVSQLEYGVRIDPVMEQCYNKCRELVNQSSEVIRDCVDKCRK